MGAGGVAAAAFSQPQFLTELPRATGSRTTNLNIAPKNADLKLHRPASQPYPTCRLRGKLAI
jgi:hypothetical protein